MASKPQNKKAPAKRGPRDHFTGLKLQFLTGEAVNYQAALDTKWTGKFYDKTTHSFIAKFGDGSTDNLGEGADIESFGAEDRGEVEDNATRGSLTQQDADSSATKFNIM